MLIVGEIGTFSYALYYIFYSIEISKSGNKLLRNDHQETVRRVMRNGYAKPGLPGSYLLSPRNCLLFFKLCMFYSNTQNSVYSIVAIFNLTMNTRIRRITLSRQTYLQMFLQALLSLLGKT